jgi:hypothetical protein
MGRTSKKKLKRQKKIEIANELYKRGTCLASIRSSLNNTSNTLHDTRFQEIISCQKLKKYYFVNTGQEVQCIVLGLIKNDLPLIQCAHLRVGSSQVSKLLACNYTVKDSHKYYSTAVDRYIGAYSEQASAITFGYERKLKDCRASQKLPFISATPDFVLEDRLIEVKSHTHPTKVQKDDILQLLISMEIFGKTYGEIHMYTVKVEGKKQEAKATSTKLYQVYGIIKKASIFTPHFVHYACQGYMNYLSILLQCIGISPTSTCISEGMTILLENAKQTIGGDQILTYVPTTSICLKTLTKVKTPRPNNKRDRFTFLWSKSSRNFNHYREEEVNYRAQVEDIIKAWKYPHTILSKVASNYISSETSTNIKSFEQLSGRLTYTRPSKQPKIDVNIEESNHYDRSAYIYDETDIYNLIKSYYTVQSLGKPTSEYVFANKKQV